jgi:hypothetical protein
MWRLISFEESNMKTQWAGSVRLLSVVLLFVGFVSACHSNEATSDTNAKSKVDYRSAGKPTAAIDIRHAVMGRPELGEPIMVRVTVTPGRGVTELHLQLIADAGLSIDVNDGSFTRRYGAEPEPTTYEVMVTPLAEGLSYLTILATINVGGRSQSRTSAVALQVGPVQESLSTPRTDGASSEAVISLPAAETTN